MDGWLRMRVEGIVRGRFSLRFVCHFGGDGLDASGSALVYILP